MFSSFDHLYFYRWSKHFSDAIESFNRREGKSKLKEPFNDDDSDSERVHDLPPANEVAPERAEAVGGEEHTTQQQQSSIATSVASTASSSKDEHGTSIISGDSDTVKDEDQNNEQEENDDQQGIPSDSKDTSTHSPGKIYFFD